MPEFDPRRPSHAAGNRFRLANRAKGAVQRGVALLHSAMPARESRPRGS
jgi:hypothetical protein